MVVRTVSVGGDQGSGDGVLGVEFLMGLLQKKHGAGLQKSGEGGLQRNDGDNLVVVLVKIAEAF